MADLPDTFVPAEAPDSPEALEAALRALTPRGPSPGLMRRLTGELDTTAVAFSPVAAPPLRRWSTAMTWTSWKWANWAAAAAVVGGFVWLEALAPRPSRDARSPAAAWQPASSGAEAMATPALARVAGPANPSTAPGPGAEPADVRPVAAENLLVSLQDEGLVLLDDGRAVRRVRAWYLDTITWREPATNRSLRWSVPREEVRVVPVSIY